MVQAAVVAAWFRVCTSFLVAILVITSVVREFADKGLELVLSLPLSRAAWYAGKLAGCAMAGVLLAAGFAVLMLVWAPPAAVLAWFISLALEAALVASASLFFVITLAQVVPALAATAAFYLLSRATAAAQAIAAGPLGDPQDLVQRTSNWILEAIALMLPPLEAATQTGWLLYSPPAPLELARISAALVAYGALLAAAGLFDFHRRNL
jgi:ABC-type transport system involved in multi-copper enzyme maturation permease subunit